MSSALEDKKSETYDRACRMYLITLTLTILSWCWKVLNSFGYVVKAKTAQMR